MRPTISLRHTTDALVRTYLGADPGSKVLAGQVKPGDVQRLEAAIWFSDMRGFTRLSTELSSRDLVATLNDYFGVLSTVVTENGGEILKFIGDANRGADHIASSLPVGAKLRPRPPRRAAVTIVVATTKKPGITAA